MSQSLGLWDIARLFVYLSPLFLLMLIPVACMLSVFMTFLRMGNDRELVALKASGVGLLQMLRAPVVFCLLCVAANFLVSFHGVAWGMSHFRSTLLEFAKSKTQLAIQAGVFNRDFPGLTFYARTVDAKRGELRSVFVEDRTRSQAPGVIVAPSGWVVTDHDKGVIQIVLQDGKIYHRQGDKIGILEFGSYAVRLDLANLLKTVDLAGEPRPKELSWRRLLRLERDPTLAKSEDVRFMRKVAVEKQKRLALPLACLALGLFGLPVASAFQGLRQSLGVITALGCFLLYYVLLSLGLSLGESGALPPIVGLWTPNLLFLALGLEGIRLAAKERTPSLAWLGLSGGKEGRS